MIVVDVQPNLPAARVPYGDARLGVMVARRAWPASPCNGHEQVVETRKPPALQGMPVSRPGYRFVGIADLHGQRCLIWIMPRMDRATTCTTVVHEAGHWAGLEHTDADRFPVMGEAYAGTFPGCAVPS